MKKHTRKAGTRKVAPERVPSNQGMPPAPPPIGSITPIRDVPDEFVFRFELGPAILAQLLEHLRRATAITIATAAPAAKYPGFYQIFLKSQPKYIGKTSRPIRSRLLEHITKLSGRRGIRLDDVTCKYAFVEDPSLVDVSENALITYFSKHGMAEWNTTGFGSKVPGRGRSGQVASKWDEQYPHNLAADVMAGSDEPITLTRLAQQIAKRSPITFSIPTSFRAQFRRDHPDAIAVPKHLRPFEEWVSILEKRLAPGWHIDRQAPGWYIVPRK